MSVATIAFVASEDWSVKRPIYNVLRWVECTALPSRLAVLGAVLGRG